MLSIDVERSQWELTLLAIRRKILKVKERRVARDSCDKPPRAARGGVTEPAILPRPLRAKSICGELSHRASGTPAHKWYQSRSIQGHQQTGLPALPLLQPYCNRRGGHPPEADGE